MRYLLLLCAIACGNADAYSRPIVTKDGGVDLDTPGWDCTVEAVQVRYVSNDSPPPVGTTSVGIDTTRCNYDAAGNCTIDLEGYLFAPQNRNAHAPAIVWNHGSESEPGRKCAIAQFFTSQGYLVFVPHRRGYGLSSGLSISAYLTSIKSTDTWVDTTRYMQMQAADVAAAVAFVAGMSNVNAAQIAIMGHSYGGIETVYTNAMDVGQRVAVDFCGASESWSVNTSEHTALLTAVDAAVAPMFFLQPANDVNTTPTVTLSGEAGSRRAPGQVFQAAIYPPVPNVTTPQEAHARFVGDATQIAIWGPAVLDFLHRYGM
jgi:dienelactone hydrolase